MITRNNYNRESKMSLAIIILTLSIASCFITFMISIDNNIGIIPLMYILFFIYSIVNMLNGLFYEDDLKNEKPKSLISKTQILLMFVSAIMFLITYIVLWM